MEEESEGGNLENVDEGNWNGSWVSVLGHNKLMKRTIKPGRRNGVRPVIGQRATVRCVGRLEDGTTIDDYERLQLILGDGDFVDAFDRCIPLMKIGEICEIIARDRYAYGAVGRDPDVPGFATVSYEIELLQAGNQPNYSKMSIDELAKICETNRSRGCLLFYGNDFLRSLRQYKRAIEITTKIDVFDHIHGSTDAICVAKIACRDVNDCWIRKVLTLAQFNRFNRVLFSKSAFQMTEGLVALARLALNLHVYVADSLRMLEQYAKAEQLCDMALRLQPENTFALRIKAQICNKRGDMDQAIALLREARGFAGTPKHKKYFTDLIAETAAMCIWNKLCSACCQRHDEDPAVRVIRSLPAIEPRRRKLESSVDGVLSTSDDNKPDLISGNCSERMRAIMPCGHVVGPQSLFDYCSNAVLAAGNSEITCPRCNAVWTYHIVRHAADLGPSEAHDFETRLSENYLRRTPGYKKCKGCGIWCCRADDDALEADGDDVDGTTFQCPMVRCPVCTARKGRCYDFCWTCRDEWQDDPDGKCCNPDCKKS